MTTVIASRPSSARAAPRRGQAGVSMLGILFWLLVMGFFAMIGLKLLPIYLNQLKVTKAVEQAAHEAKGPDDVAGIKRTLSRTWDVDDIDHIEAKDVQVTREPDSGVNSNGPKPLVLSYDYEARVNFAYNIDIVVHFKKSVPVTPGAGASS